MPRWRLIPISGLASEITQDVCLNGSLRIGRNVVGPDALTLPPTLTQFSGVHCRVYADLSSGNVQWFVEDTSTNGTFVDGERIVRNTSVRLLEGSRLRLSSPPQETLEFEFVRDDVEDERGDNYSHYSRPQHQQHGLVHQHHVSQYPPPYASAAPLAAAVGSGGVLQAHMKAQQNHGMNGGVSGVGGGSGVAAGIISGGGEGISVPSNPQVPSVNHKRKVGELADGSGDNTAVHVAAPGASAVAPNRSVARRINNNTPASGAGGGGVTMSYGMPPMGIGGGGTAAAAMAAARQSSAAVPSFYAGHGNMTAPLGSGAGGAGATAEALVHVQAQLRAEKNEKEVLKRQLEALRRECDDATRNLAALREQHARQLDRSANERQMSTSREESLRSMLAAAEARAELVSRQADTVAERARGELGEAEAARRHAEREAADAKAQLAASREELERLNAELRAERSDAAAQRAAAAAARRETESVREALAAEQRDKKAEQERAERLQQQVDVEKASAAAARRMAGQHEAEVRAARTQAEEEQRGRRAVSEEALSLRGQLEEARRQLVEAHERISGLQDELAARHHRLSALSKSHAQVEQLLSGLEQTVTALTHMHSSLGHQYAQAMAAGDAMPQSGGGGGGNVGGAGAGGAGDGPVGQGHGTVGGQQPAGALPLGPQTEAGCAEEQTGVMGLADNSEGLRAMMQQSQLGGGGMAETSHMGLGHTLGTLQLHPPSTMPGYGFNGGGPSPARHHNGPAHPHAGGTGMSYSSAGGNGVRHNVANLLPTPSNGGHGQGHCHGNAAAQNQTQQLHLMSQHQQQHLSHQSAQQQQYPHQQQASFLMMSQQPQQHQFGQGTQQQQQQQTYTGIGSAHGVAGRGPAEAITPGLLQAGWAQQPLQRAGLATPQLPPYADTAVATARGGTQPGNTTLTPLQQPLPASQQLQQQPLGGLASVMDGIEAGAGAFLAAHGGSQLLAGNLPHPSQQQQIAAAGVIARDVNCDGGHSGGAPSAESASQQTTPAAVVRDIGSGGRQGDNLCVGAGSGGGRELDGMADGSRGFEEDEEEGDGYTSRVRTADRNGNSGRRASLAAAGALSMEVDTAVIIRGVGASGGDGGDATPQMQAKQDHASRQPHSQQKQPTTPIVSAVLPPQDTMETVASRGTPYQNVSAQPAVGGTSNGTTVPPEVTLSGGGAAPGGAGFARNAVAAWPRLFSRHLTPSKRLNTSIEAAAVVADGDIITDGDGGTPASRPRMFAATDGNGGSVAGSGAAAGIRTAMEGKSSGGADAAALVMTTTTLTGQGGQEDRGRSHSQSQPLALMHGAGDDGSGSELAHGAEPRSQELSPLGRAGVCSAAVAPLLREWGQYGLMPQERASGSLLRGTGSQQQPGLLHSFVEGQRDSLGQIAVGGTLGGTSGSVGVRLGLPLPSVAATEEVGLVGAAVPTDKGFGMGPGVLGEGPGAGVGPRASLLAPLPSSEEALEQGLGLGAGAGKGRHIYGVHDFAGSDMSE
ncbi:hypothetical protein Vretimale_17035 [Volvox reticuliferus]|uniref:Uncharacterized protein n=1 Tax=Volvox reticuliferus TaxID=1737510 RepID=A0A8J4GU31_9CHLO|nr:hypothetical protein Vretifemale_7926 [Volvox reticuliferus]GIM13933.1 hypothetical protein Vretimale_17035 [Volvox reticuliferus]